jgi:hypothetical protein
MTANGGTGAEAVFIVDQNRAFFMNNLILLLYIQLDKAVRPEYNEDGRAIELS